MIQYLSKKKKCSVLEYKYFFLCIFFKFKFQTIIKSSQFLRYTSYTFFEMIL